MSHLDEFIRDGRISYRDAKQATDAFEQELLGRIRMVVSQRTNWGPFDKARTSPSVSGNASEGYWVGLSVKGRMEKEDVAFELGYWWLTSRHDLAEKQVVFAGFSVGPDRLLAFKASEAGGHLWLSADGRSYVAAPMPADMNPAPALSGLLDTLVKLM